MNMNPRLKVTGDPTWPKAPDSQDTTVLVYTDPEQTDKGCTVMNSQTWYRGGGPFSWAGASQSS